MRPTGMQMFQVQFGPAQSLALGTLLRMVVRFTPSTSAIWAATKTPLPALCEKVEAAAGLQGTATLPSPDQPGFVDGYGNTVRNWTYKAETTFLLGNDIVGRTSVDFTWHAGDNPVIDLEQVVPLPSTTGGRVAVTVPVKAALDGGQLVLFDITGAEMFRGNVQGPAGTSAFDAGTEY
jgi:hypothetical protein